MADPADAVPASTTLPVTVLTKNLVAGMALGTFSTIVVAVALGRTRETAGIAWGFGAVLAHHPVSPLDRPAWFDLPGPGDGFSSPLGRGGQSAVSLALLGRSGPMDEAPQGTDRRAASTKRPTGSRRRSSEAAGEFADAHRFTAPQPRVEDADHAIDTALAGGRPGEIRLAWDAGRTRTCPHANGA